MSQIECSVIVALNPHHNDLSSVLDSYLEQTASSSFEVIMVNGGARDYAPRAYDEHRRRYPSTPVRLLTVEGAGRAAANNAGARASQSDLLLFVGDDFVPTPTLVRAHLELHRNIRDGAAVGIGPSFFPDALRGDPFRCWLEDSGTLFGVPFRLASSHWPRTFFYAGNASIGRESFDELGGFDDALHDTGDDFEFGLRLNRLGVRSHFLPKAFAWHDHAVTLPERIEALQRSGERARRIVARHGAIAQWAKFLAQPLADFAIAAFEAEERHCAVSNPVTRIRRYEALLDLAFAEGFHASGPGSASA
jgi:GT2 family glycosyltransferase